MPWPVEINTRGCESGPESNVYMTHAPPVRKGQSTPSDTARNDINHLWQGMPQDEVLARFHSKYAKLSDGCWHWDAAKDKRGYGQFCIRYKRFVAHRFAYEVLVGPIPNGLVLDHLCCNKSCVNPDHLEPVTVQVNSSRAGLKQRVGSRQSHCPLGHAMTVPNTIYHRNGRSTCRQCTKASQGRSRELRRLRLLAEREAMVRPKSQAEMLSDSIVNSLSLRPATIYQLMDRTGFTRDDLRGALQGLAKSGAIHIAGKFPPRGSNLGRGKPAHIWALNSDKRPIPLHMREGNRPLTPKASAEDQIRALNPDGGWWKVSRFNDARTLRSDIVAAALRAGCTAQQIIHASGGTPRQVYNAAMAARRRADREACE